MVSRSISGFNPCFLGTCPRIPGLSDGLPCAGPVSILVFLELALGCHMTDRSQVADEGFNPCFLGTCPRILGSRMACPVLGRFQSLFSWNLPSDLHRTPCLADLTRSFNPCFLGTCPRIRISTSLAIVERYSFNPCFLGTCPRIPAYWNGPNDPPLFQSLFSWNLPSDSELAVGWLLCAVFQSLFSWNLPSDLAASCTARRSTGGFNPCFLGTCPRILHQIASNSSKAFQSLFSWNLPSDSSAALPVSIPDLVSILVFLELALGCGLRAASSPRCQVSILVFLELALGYRYGLDPVIYPFVSILVFLELALGSRCLSCPRSSRCRFQSLFSWNLPSDC